MLLQMFFQLTSLIIPQNNAYKVFRLETLTMKVNKYNTVNTAKYSQVVLLKMAKILGNGFQK